MEASIEKDLAYNWHPCSQMKDYEQFKPLLVQSALGSYIKLSDGKIIIDAISSWWSKSLGHGHPRLKQAIIEQLHQFEHVVFANTTHEKIIQLSEKLSQLTKSLKKVFYASDGSCAIEIALKMSLHSRQITGELKRCKFLALQNGYHGETALALSVSDLKIYRNAYQAVLTPVKYIHSLPYINNRFDEDWNNCEHLWSNIEKQLEPYADEATAIIVEPIVQGAGGMYIYSQDFLKRLRRWTKENNVHLIADEIMTGLGRIGLPLACQHAGIEPDFLCLGKGLTAGVLPLSAALTTDSIYHLFYDDYERNKSFLHSHTFSGNALAVSVALETLSILEEENVYQHVQNNETLLQSLMEEVSRVTGVLKNIRNIGFIVAADLVPLTGLSRAGYAVYQKAVQLGALLRPLGNTIYWLPPLNCSHETLHQLKEITQQAIQSVYGLK